MYTLAVHWYSISERPVLTFKYVLRILVLVLSMGMMLPNSGTTAPSPIQLSMRVSIGSAPATFVVQTTIDNAIDPDTNLPIVRGVYVGYRGSAARSSYYEYNERTNPHTITTWFKDLHCGEYEAFGEVIRVEEGKERHYVSAPLHFRVTGIGCDGLDDGRDGRGD